MTTTTVLSDCHTPRSRVARGETDERAARPYPSPLAPRRMARARRATRGFTLAEILISLGISGFVLTGILTSYIFIGKSSVRLFGYHEMDAQARRALEQFSQDARMAFNLSSFSSTDVVLNIIGPSGPMQVQYFYDAPSQQFRRRAAGTTTILMTGVDQFQFKRYNLQQNPAVNILETKQLQLEMRSIREGITVADATQVVLTARIIMRNKRTSN